MASNSGMDMSYVLDVLQGVLDKQTQVDPVSQAFYNNLLNNFNTVVGTLKDANNINKTELNKIAEYVKKTLSSNYGVQYTQQFKDLISEFKSAAKVAIDKKEQIDATKLVAGLSNIVSTAISQSLMAEKRGDKKGALLKNTTEANAKALAEEIAKKLGLEGALDRGIDKVLAFLGVTNKDNQKKQKNLMEDLVDALGKGRLGKIGQDIFRIVGFMGARWLSQFGQFGKIMGGLFYVAMESFAPILANLLVTGMGKLITGMILPGLQGAVGSICRAIWGSKLVQGAGARIGTIIHDLSGKEISPALQMLSGKGAEKAIGAAKVGGLGLVGTGALIGAGWAGGEAVDSWKQGKKGNAAALGIGAGLMGAGGLAALASIFVPAIGGALAIPLAPIAIGVAALGAVVGGLSFWWKKAHQEDKEKDKEEKSFWQSFVDWIKDHLPWGDNKDNHNFTDYVNNLSPNQTYNLASKDSSAQLLSGKQKGVFDKHLDPSKMTEEDWKRADSLKPIYGKMGEIVNLGQMSRKRAMEVVKADIAQKGNKSFYEALTADVADLGSFGTDIPFAAKGTMDRFKALKAQMIKEGVVGAENAKITSAIGTLGSRQRMSPHSYTDSIYGHFGSNATTIDIINSATRKGYNISDAQAKKYGIAYVNREGDHDHISFGVLNSQIAAQEAHAQRQSITSKALVEASNVGGGYKAFEKWLLDEKQIRDVEKLKNVYGEDWYNQQLEQYLRAKGIRKEADTEGKEHWVTYEKGVVPGTSKRTGMEAVLDPTGNVTFEKVKFNLQAATNKGLNN